MNLVDWLPSCFVIFCVLAFIGAKGSNWPKAVLAYVWISIFTLFPVLGFYDVYFMRYSFVADHYSYMVLPIFIAAIVQIVALLIASRKCRSALIFFSMIVALAAVNHPGVKNGDLSQRTSVLGRRREKNPAAWYGANNLGTVFVRQNQLDKGIAQI